jgi:hypothetical protein
MIIIKTNKDFDLMALDEVLGKQGLSADKYPDEKGYRSIATAENSNITQEQLEAAIAAL